MNSKFKNIRFTRFRLAVCLVIFYSLSTYQIFAQNKPNILFICTDEQHPAISGFRGNPVVKTPNLDALAADGMYFTRAYVASPVCAPSRAAYMFGKHIHQLNYWYNGQAWPKDEVTWATRVTQSGYYTAHYGKMDSPGLYGKLGFNEEWNSAERPERISPGPDMRFDPEHPRLAKGHLEVKTFDINEYTIDAYTAGPKKYGQYAVDRPSINHALRFLENRNSDKKPWMLHVGLLMPHWPITLPQKYYDMYANVDIPMPHDAKFPNKNIHPALQHFQKWDGLDEQPSEEKLKNALRGYYGMISCVDDMLGELITELKKNGMYENTYIIFTSDHGDNLGEHGLMGNKHTPMEASVAVPLVITGPRVKQGVKIETPVSLVDMYPTIMNMAGINYTDPEMPGKNLLPILEGKEAANDRTVFSEWHGLGFPASWYMLVNEKYKYIYYERDRPSLFDMENDPKELNDLALNDDYSYKLKEFETELKNRIDPVKVAQMARKYHKLITDDGKELIFGEAPFPKSK
ncbi:choline-sulfatase [Mariniflexile fucanivorans]|uniref:Choline-sulfatase n=1 Tax=Mariniflexile fucanivorans TaxID=264023 RepID=A0A4R1RKT3_9FLAO|nr:sulfatase-like hydrolase/transferase [Mariniflexile fucanivorans]TCL66813.1 choline-sulfatase [Mariniflexile fucanivorans]